MITNFSPFAWITPRRSAVLKANRGVSEEHDDNSNKLASSSASTRIFGMDEIIAKPPRIATTRPLTSRGVWPSPCDGRCDNPRRTVARLAHPARTGAAFGIPIRPDFVLVSAADVERPRSRVLRAPAWPVDAVL